MNDDLESYVKGSVYQTLFLFTAFSLIVLPFTTSFNEALTKIVERMEIVSVIQGYLAPFTVRVISSLLSVLGIPSVASESSLYLTGGWMPIEVYVNWNCIGWQSFIVFVLTLVTGLQGDYTIKSKVLTVILGLEGTFIVNTLRILIPTLLVHFLGRLAAVFFHDFLGALMTLIWLCAFWFYAFNHILVKEGGD